MAVIQCKMCGGTVDLPQDVTTGECPYCGTLTTFPKINNEHKEQLYSRAEHFRRQNDFDKAVSAYEALLNEDSSDPEAYWGLVLSRFGIEYVEDPVSHERIPTCHRVQFESILTDADYQMVLENSSGLDREIYEKEAQRIAEIQKNILAISSQEKPFDVFICYKETADGGTRTKDSEDAQEIYYQLVNAGYKVFFARITLEDKLGQQYEPYIFAALNSAKVMLVIGSKKEYFEAVWVKNEWSRFLALKKKDRSKMLIPCYKNMTAYDLPQELSLLQSQDMSKIGFIQDLVRGIEKVVRTEKTVPKAKAGEPAAAEGQITPLMKRIVIFLSTNDWFSADEYCEKVLDLDPELAQAYVYKLQAKYHLAAEDELCEVQDLESDVDFQMAMRFADATVKQRLNTVLERQAEIKKEEEEKKRQEEEKKRREEEKRLRQLIEEYRTATENRTLRNVKGLGNLLQESKAEPKLAEARDQLIRRVYEYAVSLEIQPDGMTDHDHFKNMELSYDLLRKICDDLPEANDRRKKADIYNDASYQLRIMKNYYVAEELFEQIPDYADSAKRAAACFRTRSIWITIVLLSPLLFIIAILASCSILGRR